MTRTTAPKNETSRGVMRTGGLSKQADHDPAIAGTAGDSVSSAGTTLLVNDEGAENATSLRSQCDREPTVGKDPRQTGLSCLAESRRSVGILGIVFAAVLLWGCPDAAAGSELGELTKHVDFENYQSLEEAQAAFNAAFPVGSGSGPLRAYLNIVSDSTRSFKTKTIQRQPVDYFVYEKTIDVGNKNKNLWAVLLFVDENDIIHKSEIRLLYEDENFPLRGVPFRFENFSRAVTFMEITRKALLDLLGDDITPERVHQVMTSAGARRNSVKETNGQTKIYYRYMEKIGLTAEAFLVEPLWILV